MNGGENMSLVSSKLEDNKLFIFLKGRVDSSNSEDIKAEIVDILDKETYEDLVLDIEDLEYISSAGLRVVLFLRKGNPNFKIINASSEVFEIFEMTGFSEMMTIEKAYRKLSVDGCEVIGRGANGEVYRYDPDTIIKVYFNSDALPDIHRERQLARKALVLGIPTAIPYDVVKVGNSYGSVFELLNAKSFTKIIAEDASKLDEVVTMYVDLLKKIHSTEVGADDMPNMKDVVSGWANFLKDYLPAEKAQKLVKLVSDVPENLHMIHGDYHTKNVMIQNGEVLLIDMDTLAYGDPVFEFASVFNAFVGFYEPYGDDDRENFIGLTVRVSKEFFDKTVRLYFGTDDEEKLREIVDKAALIGYTRLMRRLIRRNGLENEEGKMAINFYKNRIEELLDKVDTLLF